MTDRARVPHPAIAAVLVVLAAVVPYLGVLDAPWVFDDVKLVRDNDLLRADGEEAARRLGASFDVTSQAWRDAELRENYRPLRFLSYWVDFQLARAAGGEGFTPDDPPTFFFHLQNVIWHAANALLVLLIARRLLGSRAAGLAVALLFALHPLFTEAVTYVSSRRDVLSTFFWLAGLGLWLRSGPDEPPRWSAVLLAPVLLGLGFLAKEMVVTLPAVVLLVDLARRVRLSGRRVAGHLALWSVAGLCIAVTLSHRELIAGPVGGGAGPTLLTIPRYIVRYLGLVLWPASLSVDYSWNAIPVSRGLLEPWSTLPAALGVAALGGAALVALAGRRRALAVGLGWFLVALTPVLQIVPIPERFAERFAYLPAIGILLLAGALWERLRVRRPRAAWALLAAVALALGGRTLARNGDWSSRVALWESAVEAQPRAARAWLAYGNALRELDAQREAEEAYTRALELWEEAGELTSLQRGQALQARMFRGGTRAVLGKDDEEALQGAIEDLRAVLASTDTDGTPIAESPRHTILHHELASCLLRAEKRDAAEARFRRVLEIGEPDTLVAQAHYWLGKIAILDRDVPRAVECFRRAVRALPRDDPSVWTVAIELADHLSNLAEDHERAWSLLEGLLERDPSDRVRVAIHLRMARILDRQGEVDECRRRLERALEIDPGNVAVLVTLAGIEANLGLLERAEERYLGVLRRDPSHRDARQGLQAVRARQRLARQGSSAARRRNETLRGLVSRARKHRRRGELLAARDVWSRLVRAGARLGEAEGVAIGYCGLAEVEELLGRPGHARRALREAEKARPGRPETLLATGRFLLRRGDEPGAARDYLLRYLEALPEGEDPDPRAWLDLGELARKRDPARAIECFLRARELGIDEELGADAHALDRTLGALYVREERWRDAYDAFQRYIEKSAGRDAAARAAVLRRLEREVIPRLLDAGPAGVAAGPVAGGDEPPETEDGTGDRPDG